MEFWNEKLGQISEDVVRGIILERFPGSTNLICYDDYEGGLWAWVYQTCCMHLSLSDPDGWFVLAVWEYLEIQQA